MPRHRSTCHREPFCANNIDLCDRDGKSEWDYLNNYSSSFPGTSLFAADTINCFPPGD